MRVLLINKQATISKSPPLGLAIIASLLENDGGTVRFIDAFPGQEIKIEEVLDSFKPDAVGLSFSTASSFDSYGLSKRIKAVGAIA